MTVDRTIERLRQLGRLLAYASLRFYRDGAARMASALAYTSLLAMVPLLAIIVAVMGAFPVFDDAREQLQVLIFQYFVPEVGEAVRFQLMQFVSNTGQLTAVGVVGLAVTAIMLLITIEGSLNDIFRVDKARSWASGLLVYWTVITLGPLLIGASFSVWGYVGTVGVWAAEEGVPVGWLTRILPTLLVMVAFALLYYAVPNRPVRVLDAVLGGVIAGLIFAFLRFAFGYYVGTVRTYEAIYGALSVIPIFLIWMYLSWAVVLAGAEVVASLPEWRAGRQIRPGSLPAKRRLAVALEILSLLHRASLRGASGLSRASMLDHTAEAEQPLRAILGRLRDAGYVAKTAPERYILARDLEAASVYELVRDLDLGLGPEDYAGLKEPWSRALEERAGAIDRAERQMLGLSLRSLLMEEKREDRRAAS